MQQNASAFIELRDLQLTTDIGTYGPDDTVPEQHLLDLTLEISSDRVVIEEDSMSRVFDYDPLIQEIDRLAGDGHYETQERLMIRIAQACAAHPVVRAIEISLRKRPVRSGHGALGVRLILDRASTDELRCGG
jgi:dihydroneopterin aldolase